MVDPIVSKVLRPHQRSGVQFIFDCLYGVKGFSGNGCILADDMGLGKTLQALTVMWTLLTQGGQAGGAFCRKALVVCPASLVANWTAEVDKWLGGQCKFHACATAGQAKVKDVLQSFTNCRESKILFVSYETFRCHAHEVENAGIDLVVCDEAHKLKNNNASITKRIQELSAKIRLLISGTPIQNDLKEFFTLVRISNPGAFGSRADFRRNIEKPILRGREPDASVEERERGKAMLAQVSTVTDKFILRRANRLNAAFLPPKTIFNVFVNPTDIQRKLYHSFLQSAEAKKVFEPNAKVSTILNTIRKLQSLVNHPSLVRTPSQSLEAGFDDDTAQVVFEELDKSVGGKQKPVRQELSGKLALLYEILNAIKVSGCRTPP